MYVLSDDGQNHEYADEISQQLKYEVIKGECMTYRTAVQVGSATWKQRECDGPRFATLAEARAKAKEWNADYRQMRTTRLP